MLGKLARGEMEAAKSAVAKESRAEGEERKGEGGSELVYIFH